MDKVLAFSFLPQTLVSWLQAGLYIVGIISAGTSAWKYWQNSKQRRVRWLYDLYQRFYDNEEFQKMSAKIEAGNTSFIDNDDMETLVILDQYLNFFEFVGVFWHKKGLQLDEIKDMFDYTLRQIAKNDTVLEYIREFGYEQLDALLKKLGYTS